MDMDQDEVKMTQYLIDHDTLTTVSSSGAVWRKRGTLTIARGGASVLSHSARTHGKLSFWKRGVPSLVAVNINVGLT